MGVAAAPRAATPVIRRKKAIDHLCAAGLCGPDARESAAQPEFSVPYIKRKRSS
jgi:hypothetical protein